ncbi:ATP synthase epsilon chain [bacterium BMS3Bbin07]|nr:ATP synthase epsilon chain [bacterium BMS3Bbin07]
MKTFRFTVITPMSIILDEEVGFLRAEDSTGSFGILPNHTEFITILTPSVVIYRIGEREGYLAVNGGIFRFASNAATLSTRIAVSGDSLDTLTGVINERFMSITEREKALYRSLKQMQQSFLKRIADIERESG